ncbi:LysR family transcriptional regulator [Roseicyclus sp.]|uniref:LysR family transcriptional regulator n=1 Tax=Roseicyclus sp. TaxID=1914329 RepID=UPI0026278C71|nr:LysR family transcriptional regulator [Roseicyclus sp.]
MCVTQSAVSHQVRHLEEWLDRPLFDRSGTRPRLLPEAEDLARVAALSLDGITAACERLGKRPAAGRW